MLCTAAIFPLGVEENEPARHTHFRQQRKWRHSLSATPEPHRARQQQLLLKERRQQSPLILFPSFSSEPSFTRNRLSLPFDILTDLPIELSLSILSYLPPQDLISVCLVCHKWYNLAQDRALRKRRLVYIRNQRFNFQLSKENYGSVNAAVPVHVHVTPSVAVTSRPVLSPVNYSDTHYTHSEPQYFHFQQPTSPSWPHLRTPSSTFSSVVDGVEKLSLKPEGSDIRRCLFPDENEKSVCEGGVARPLPRRSNRRSDLQGSGRSSVDLVLCKRTNKSRLRRL